MTGNQALAKAVSDAVEKEAAGGNENVGEVKDEKVGQAEPQTEKPEEKEPEQKDEKQQEKPEEDERTRDAKQLYAALENPTTSKQVVEELARRVGLQIQQQPQQTPKVATKSIIERMKENVAPEYHFLVDNLAPAIQGLVKEHLETELGPVRQTMAQQQEAQARKEVEVSYEKMKAKHDDFVQLEPKMNEIATRMKMAPGTSLDIYLEDLYTLAARDKVTTKAVQRTVDKINRNANEARPASAEVNDAVRSGSKLPTLQESINAAVRGERFS